MSSWNISEEKALLIIMNYIGFYTNDFDVKLFCNSFIWKAYEKLAFNMGEKESQLIIVPEIENDDDSGPTIYYRAHLFSLVFHERFPTAQKAIINALAKTIECVRGSDHEDIVNP